MIRLELKVTYAMLQEWCLDQHLATALATAPTQIRELIYKEGYEAGKEAGYEEGIEHGVEQGKQFRNANDLGVANVRRDTSKKSGDDTIELIKAAERSARRRTRPR